MTIDIVSMQDLSASTMPSQEKLLTMKSAKRFRIFRRSAAVPLACLFVGLTAGQQAHATQYSVLYNFDRDSNGIYGPYGCYPFTGLVESSSNVLYGANWHCPGPEAMAYYQCVYTYATSTGAMTNINVFPVSNGFSADIFKIQGPLIQGSDGNLYGTTYNGGPNFPFGGVFNGVTFKLTPSGTMTYIHIFGDGTVANDGTFPAGGLLQGSDGNFYGTNSSGGGNGNGTFYKLALINNVWTETILYRFPGVSNGPRPLGSLVQDANGNFYGLTMASGPPVVASVFKLSQSGGVWAQTVLYTFNSGTFGAPAMNSATGLTFDTQGNLWAAMPGGPTSPNQGIAFKVANPAGVPTVTIVHNFHDGSVANDGIGPYGRLVLASDGNFYGTTCFGGSTYNSPSSLGYGTVFKMTPAGAVTILHSFTAGRDGLNPMSGVIQAHNGYLYGTTTDLTQVDGQGTLFRIIL